MAIVVDVGENAKTGITWDHNDTVTRGKAKSMNHHNLTPRLTAKI